MGKCACGKTIDPKYSCTIDYKPVCKQCFDKAQEDHAVETRCTKPMLRLHKLTLEQIEDWRVTRADVGREKYGDAHLQRYGAVDVMEELLDAENILNLLSERLGNQVTEEIDNQIANLEYALEFAVCELRLLDTLLPDSVCTDERGGERIWWSEQD